MVLFSKILRLGQVHVTAIMTLIAGMPYFVCACSPSSVRNDLPQPAIQLAECRCCGSCGSNSGCKPTSESSKHSCCNSRSISRESQPNGNSPQARGKGCRQLAALPNIQGAVSAPTSKPIKTLSSMEALPVAILTPVMPIGPQRSDFRWTGHAPAPPPDLITSLQRLLI